MKRILMTAFLLAILLGTTKNIKAESSAHAAVAFSVEAVIPDNQEIKNVPYFHLQSEGALHQDLIVKVYNHSTETITVKATLNTADTSTNGQILYDGSKNRSPHPSLLIAIEDIAAMQEEIKEIPAQQSTDYVLRVNADKLNHEGIILGGINFAQVSDKEEGISQAYEYNIAVVLASFKGPLHSSKSLEFLNIENKIINGQKITEINFLNPEAQILSDLSLDIKIFDDQNNQVLDYQNEDLTMAPNTEMNTQLNWGIDDLKPGIYRTTISARSFEENWTWEETFEIDKDTAQSMNKETVNKYYLSQLTVVLSIVLGIATVVNTVSLIIDLRKEQNQL